MSLPDLPYTPYAPRQALIQYPGVVVEVRFVFCLICGHKRGGAVVLHAHDEEQMFTNDCLPVPSLSILTPDLSRATYSAYY